MSSYPKRNQDWQAYGQTHGRRPSRHWQRAQQLQRKKQKEPQK